MSDVVSSVPRGCSSYKLMQRLLAVLGLAVLYCIAAKVGMALALPNASKITPVWPPAPIAWAALYLWGYWLAPAVWLGDLAMNIPNFLSSNADWGRAFVLSLGKASISASTAVLGVFLLRFWIRDRALIARVQHVLRFCTIGMLCPMLTPLLGLSWYCSAGVIPWAAFPDIWLTWWIGDAISILLLMPMLVTWKPVPWRKVIFHPRQWQEWWQGLVLVLSMGGLGYIAFLRGHSVEYLLIPLLLWATFRFGQVFATGGIVLVASMAVWGTSQGLSSFIRPSLNESLLLLQTFMGALAITTLMLSAAFAEKNRSQQDLAHANATLEMRVQERTAALAEANDSLIQEIQERLQIEKALRTSEVEKTHLIESLEDKTMALESTLIDLKKTQAQLIQTEKMSSLGQLVAGIAHEINNPVSFIYGNLTYANTYMQELLLLLQDYQTHCPSMPPALQQAIAEVDLEFIQQDFPAVLASMKTGADRIRQLVLTLRNFTRLDEAHLKWVNLHDGLESTLLILNHRLQSQGTSKAIHITKHYGDLPTVECYADELNQVFMNILNNAIDALIEYRNNQENHDSHVMPTIKISTQLLEKDDRATPDIAISIWNNGPAIPEAMQARIFDPFFTTKPIGQGSGLGLSISHYIVHEKHQGKLTLRSDDQGGTEFLISIPQQQTSA